MKPYDPFRRDWWSVAVCIILASATLTAHAQLQVPSVEQLSSFLQPQSQPTADMPTPVSDLTTMPAFIPISVARYGYPAGYPAEGELGVEPSRPLPSEGETEEERGRGRRGEEGEMDSTPTRFELARELHATALIARQLKQMQDQIVQRKDAKSNPSVSQQLALLSSDLRSLSDYMMKLSKVDKMLRKGIKIRMRDITGLRPTPTISPLLTEQQQQQEEEEEEAVAQPISQLRVIRLQYSHVRPLTRSELQAFMHMMDMARLKAAGVEVPSPPLVEDELVFGGRGPWGRRGRGRGRGRGWGRRGRGWPWGPGRGRFSPWQRFSPFIDIDIYPGNPYYNPYYNGYWDPYWQI